MEKKSVQCPSEKELDGIRQLEGIVSMNKLKALLHSCSIHLINAVASITEGTKQSCVVHRQVHRRITE